jgi:hypothetical protein
MILLFYFFSSFFLDELLGAVQTPCAPVHGWWCCRSSGDASTDRRAKIYEYSSIKLSYEYSNIKLSYEYIRVHL